MNKKSIIIVTFAVVLLISVLWLGGLIPKQIAKVYGTKYMSDNFPKMQLEYENIEWNKYYGDYIITFKDKENQNYGCVIGPKYLPISIGQGINLIMDTYQEKYIQNTAGDNLEVNDEINNEQNEPIDVTQKILNGKCYSSGIIDSIDDNYIYFTSYNTEKCYLNKNSFSYINARTAKEMNVNDVNVGDYLDNQEKRIIIFRNLSGDELNKELLYNMTLTEEERIMLVNTIDVRDINITDNNTAIVNIRYGDIISELTDEEFETVVEFNSNTKFYSKGNNINSINDLENAKFNLNTIVLDRDSIYKKNPAIVKRFECTDN